MKLRSGGVFPGRVLVWVVVLVAVAGCFDSPAERRRRVLLVGIDGATPRIVLPLMKAGQLPALASIAAEGVYGQLRSYPPLMSPRIWTSIATGKKPRQHGVYSFTNPAADGGKRLIASFDRKVHAIWNMASDRGLRVATINWWVTHPPERINGVMISDHFLPGVAKGRAGRFNASEVVGGSVVHPDEWAERVGAVVRERRAASSEIDPIAEAVLPDWVNREALSTWYRDDASVGAMALEVLDALEPDVMLVLFKGVDAASHVLIGMADPSVPEQRRPPGTPEQIAGGARVLGRFYQHTDEMIGRMLEHYRPDDLVVVVSDHGFETRRVYSRLTGKHEGDLAARALLIARGEGIAPGSRPRERVDIYQITPTILSWLGLPVGADMDGAPAGFLGLPEPDRIATWDTHPIDRMQPGRGSAEDEIMEQLEALGYFEGDQE